VSPRRLRYVLGTARRDAIEALRRIRGQVRRRPPCATAVPRPRLAASGTQPLELTHALTASDLNPRYVDLWPVAKRAWSEIGGLEPMLVLVAERRAVPPTLASDSNVFVFEPEPTISTVFQAQCIRLLYPALLESQGAVIVTDVDMVPMNRRYIHRPLARIDRAHFVSYRDVLLQLGEIPICYNAALPTTWASVFDIRDADDVRNRLRLWAEGVDYADIHGGPGWTTDQRQLYRILLDRGRSRRDVWILDDYYTGHRRLERAYVEKWGIVSEDARRGIQRGAFSDFHLLHADGEHVGLNEAIVETAIEAIRVRARPRRGASLPAKSGSRD
jgi:hypothetical protein